MILIRSRPLRTLHFDFEARPLSWYAGDQVSKEITAIAWSWIGEDEVHCSLLTRRRSSLDVIRPFLRVYNEANIVTGHYIRGFDLPLLNATLVEHGQPALGPKLTSDTFQDLTKMHGMSRSQEALGAMLGLDHEKYHMDQTKWREGNRLTRKGLEQTRTRVVHDVRQHKELRARLVEAGWLRAPRVWKP